MAKTTPHYDLMVEILTENRPSNHTGIPPTDSEKELIIQLLQFSGACLTRAQVEKIREFHFESPYRLWNDSLRILIDVDRDDLQSFRSQFVSKIYDRRHFIHTGCAPRGPKID